MIYLVFTLRLYNNQKWQNIDLSRSTDSHAENILVKDEVLIELLYSSKREKVQALKNQQIHLFSSAFLLLQVNTVHYTE